MARRKKGAPGRAPATEAPEDVSSTEALDRAEDAYVPPRPLAALILAATLAAFALLVYQGVERAKTGMPRLAGRLLSIQERDQQPLGFDLSRLEGGKVSLDQLRGKVVFINFWATWCPPCIEEMPSMVRLHEKMKNDDRFVMLAISTDESWEPVKKFFAGESPGFTVLLDPKGELAKRYGTTMFPETYVVVDGKVRAFIEGPRNWDGWYAEAYLRGLMDGG